MSDTHLQQRIALITGASSGIGRATARLLSQHGLHVVLTARRVARLNDLAEEIRTQGGTALVLPADLAQADSRIALIRQIRETWGPVEVLINNAGFGWGGDVASLPWETAQAMIEVNIAALVHLTTLVLPEMVARQQGWIVNVASIAGDMPTPRIALYSATKTFVQSFSEALYRDLRRRGVHISIVNPGPIATEFGQVAYGWPEQKSRRGTTPDQAAQAVWWALRRARKRVYVPWYYRPLRWLNLTLEWALDRGVHTHLRKWQHRLLGRQ